MSFRAISGAIGEIEYLNMMSPVKHQTMFYQILTIRRG